MRTIDRTRIYPMDWIDTLKRPIRILLVDANESVRDGIRLFLETQPQLEVVAEAADGFEAIEAYRRSVPDLAIVDLMLPVLDGFGVLAHILRFDPQARVLLWSLFLEENEVKRGIAEGAKSVKLKRISESNFIREIEELIDCEPADRSIAVRGGEDRFEISPIADF